jgi:hypothetical protein
MRILCFSLLRKMMIDEYWIKCIFILMTVLSLFIKLCCWKFSFKWFLSFTDLVCFLLYWKIFNLRRIIRSFIWKLIILWFSPFLFIYGCCICKIYEFICLTYHRFPNICLFYFIILHLFILMIIAYITYNYYIVFRSFFIFLHFISITIILLLITMLVLIVIIINIC